MRITVVFLICVNPLKGITIDYWPIAELTLERTKLKPRFAKRRGARMRVAAIIPPKTIASVWIRVRILAAVMRPVKSAIVIWKKDYYIDKIIVFFLFCKSIYFLFFLYIYMKSHNFVDQSLYRNSVRFCISLKIIICVFYWKFQNRSKLHS